MSATAQAYGLGYMRASTVDNTALTPLTITQAILNALASDYNTAGSIGAKINSAASGGVDYNAMADAIRTELAAELARIDANVSTRSTPGDILRRCKWTTQPSP